MAIKRYTATTDNTITNAYRSSLLDTQRGTGSNMGAADVLEVFSIYGEASGSSGLSQELSRILIRFPVDSVITDRTAGTIPASGSVDWYLRMYNARTAFTLPRRFYLDIVPVSQSWEEGVGLDMEEYKDVTYNGSGSNWMNASGTSPAGIGTWTAAGGDYLTGSGISTYKVFFDDGYENIELNISAVVEDWILGSSGGKYDNYGLGIHLTASQEAYYSSSTGQDTSDGVLQNTVGAKDTYFTKKFFSRSSEYFFKRPVLEARWDSRKTDDRGSFYYSSSLATGPDNLNTLYLYNYVRGKLTNIPEVGTTGSVMVSLYSGSLANTAPSGAKLILHNGNQSVTGGYVSAGIYSASVAITAAATPLARIFDVWHTGTFGTPDLTQFFTGTVAPKTLVAYDNAPTFEYMTSITNLKAAYTRKEISRFRLFIRNKDWSPTIYVVANANPPNLTLQSASYKIIRVTDDLEVVSYGTGSSKSTYLSYDVSGNYFDLDMATLEAGYSYQIGLSYYNDSIGDWAEQPQAFKFRVEE